MLFAKDLGFIPLFRHSRSTILLLFQAVFVLIFLLRQPVFVLQEKGKEEALPQPRISVKRWISQIQSGQEISTFNCDSMIQCKILCTVEPTRNSNRNTVMRVKNWKEFAILHPAQQKRMTNKGTHGKDWKKKSRGPYRSIKSGEYLKVQ